MSGKPFRVHPADETDLAKSLAHFMAAVVDGIDALDTSVYSLLSSNCVGYSSSEMVWASDRIRFRGTAGETITVNGLFPRRLDWVHGKHFHFDVATDAPLLDLGSDGWLELPPLKFLFHLANGDGIASARGYIRPAVWLHLLKHSGLRDWAVFLALFGIPNIWAKVPRERFEDPKFRAAIEDALRNFGEGKPSILLEDQDVTIQPAQSGGGSNDVHPKMVGFCNAEMSKVVNGETLTTELSQTGSYAASATHEATMHGTVVADGNGIGHTMRGQLFRAVLMLNLAALAKALGHSPDEILRAIPKCGHRIEREVTPLQRAQILDIGVNKLGAKVGARCFYESFGFDPPAPGEDELKGAPVPLASGGAAVGSVDAAEGVTNQKPESETAPPEQAAA